MMLAGQAGRTIQPVVAQLVRESFARRDDGNDYSVASRSAVEKMLLLAAPDDQNGSVLMLDPDGSTLELTRFVRECEPFEVVRSAAFCDEIRRDWTRYS
jgi:hypothetical protein